jgi:hypothetical protein
MNVIGFLHLISQRIDADNRKVGVELVLKPHHSFRCLGCQKVWTFRVDAAKCYESHQGSQ